MNDSARPLDVTGTAVRALLLYALVEHQGGHAGTIRVTMDGRSFGIADDGRGHPLDKALNGVPYLRFIYTHFDYPFGTAGGTPVQLQGIGVSLVNALCSELALTVRKPTETLEVQYRYGALASSERTAVASAETGIAVRGTVRAELQLDAPDGHDLAPWLQGVLACNPELRLFLNGRALHPIMPSL